MNPSPSELPYSEQVLFSTEIIPAFRDGTEPASENDVVLVFMDKEGHLVAFAAGFRNFGTFIGMVMSLGAPIGFGKVLHVVNGQTFIHYAQFPQEEIEEIETGHSKNGEIK